MWEERGEDGDWMGSSWGWICWRMWKKQRHRALLGPYPLTLGALGLPWRWQQSLSGTAPHNSFLAQLSSLQPFLLTWGLCKLPAQAPFSPLQWKPAGAKALTGSVCIWPQLTAAYTPAHWWPPWPLPAEFVNQKGLWQLNNSNICFNSRNDFKVVACFMWSLFSITLV